MYVLIVVDTSLCPSQVLSVSGPTPASMATMLFNQAFYEAYQDYYKRLTFAAKYYEALYENDAYDRATKQCLSNNIENINCKIGCFGFLEQYYEPKLHTAMFDCRAFNIPKEEICNNLIWRQQDATRNSIQQVAHTYFAHGELNNLSCDELQEKLFQEKGINWNNYPTRLKRGSCCVRKDVFFSADEIKKKNPLYNGEGITRKKWVIDTEIPIFTQNREYIENVL